MTITRRHHPFLGQSFAVVRSGPRQFVIRLDDGSTMRVPRSWTDVDGPRPDGSEHVFTVDAIRALGELVESLAQRSAAAETVPRSQHAATESGEERSV